MDQGRQALDAVLAVLSSVLGAVLPLVGRTEAWLRGQMAVLGVPPELQTAAVLVVVALLLLTVLRVLGGLLRVALVVALIALVVQALVLAPAERPNGQPSRHTDLRIPAAASDGPVQRRVPAPDGRLDRWPPGPMAA